MSDTTHAEDELFTDTEGDDSVKDAASTTEEDELFTDTSKDEESAQDKSAAARKIQAKALVGKVISGKKSLDDVAKDTPWLLKDVESEMDSLAKQHSGLDAEQIDQLLETKLRERDLQSLAAQEAKRFDEIKAAMSKLPLTQAQKAKISQQFDALRPAIDAKVLSKATVLETALQSAGVDLNQTFEARRGALKVPSLGGYESDSQPSDMDALLSGKVLENDAATIAWVKRQKGLS